MVTNCTDEPPDVHAMVVIHRIFRQGFSELAGLARRVPADDRTWAAAVSDETEFLLNALHHHHRAEDQHLWPLLEARSAPDRELLSRMAAQHERVARAVSRARAVLPVWRDSPGGPELSTTIDEILFALGPHLDEEEARILPLCRQHLTAHEWQVMGDAAFAGFTNKEKFLALGWMVSTAIPQEAADFVGRLPLFVRALWAAVGRRRFARRMQQMRGQRRRGGEPAVR
jgi:hemerythrin-like domain-containing protein